MGQSRPRSRHDKDVGFRQTLTDAVEKVFWRGSAQPIEQRRGVVCESDGVSDTHKQNIT